MLQKNHHFFFAETYFGSFQDFEEELWDEEEEIEMEKPWTLVLGVNNTHHFQQKIGLFIHWTDDLS